MLPVGSPENTARIARIERRDRLEGFPLLHMDFYKDDPAAPGWAHRLKAHRLRRTGPNRGIRYQRMVTAIDAVLANAGFMLGGMSLLSARLEHGSLSLPFPVATGTWTSHAYQARLRGDALAWPQVRRLREWLAAEADGKRQWLARAVVPSCKRRAGGR